MLGESCLRLFEALHAHLCVGVKCDPGRMGVVCTYLLLTLSQSKCQDKMKLRPMNLSKSPVRYCTLYSWSAFRRCSVKTLVIHGKEFDFLSKGLGGARIFHIVHSIFWVFVQLSFPATQVVTLPDFLIGTCSGVELTMLIGIFRIAPSKQSFVNYISLFFVISYLVNFLFVTTSLNWQEISGSLRCVCALDLKSDYRVKVSF